MAAVAWDEIETASDFNSLRYRLKVDHNPLGLLVIEGGYYTFMWPGVMSAPIEQTVYVDLPAAKFGHPFKADTQKAVASFILTDSDFVEFELPGELHTRQYKDLVSDGSKIAFGRFDVSLEPDPNNVFIFCFDNDAHELYISMPCTLAWTPDLVLWLFNHHSKVKATPELLSSARTVINKLGIFPELQE